MGTATVVRTTVTLICLAGTWACAAGVEDAIKLGKWEISTVAPGLTDLPPGMKLGPGERLGPEGRTTVITKCASATNPLFPPKVPGEGSNLHCTIDKNDVSGGTRTFLMSYGPSKNSAGPSKNSAGPSKNSTFVLEGIVHYHGDTLDGTDTITFRTTSPSGYSLTVVSSTIRGRYLGPCDIK
jgi:hypothetical protein